MARLLNDLVKLVFPPRCIFCGIILQTGAEPDICGACYGKIPFIYQNSVKSNAFFADNKYCDGIVCVCRYSGIVKKSLIKYKFFNKPCYYRAFAGLLSDRIKNMTEYKKFDIIMSVPLYKRKKQARGYNQALLISRMVSRETGIPEKSHLLSRVKNTRTQSLLNRNERYLNVRNAFKVVHPERIKGKSVLLIDDILTTGATLEECGRTLKEAGAERVTAAVVATGRKL